MPRPDDGPDDGPDDVPHDSPRDRPAAPRLTLAMRMAERRRLRAERAERLARLVPARAERPAERPGESPVRPAAPAPAAVPPAVPLPGSDRDAAAALEEFLRSLTRGLEGGPPPGALASAPPPAPGEVLPFQRPPAAEAAGRAGRSDLARLAGAGPGLVWALRRAGIADLADLSALEPEGLAARLGPLGRLVPARAWIATARGEAGA